MSERIYQINNSIKVVFQALGGQTGITDLSMVVYDPNDNASSPVTMTEISNGLYESSFTPDEEGRWWVKITSSSYPENGVKQSYFVGGLPIIPAKIEQGIHEYNGFDNSQTKINYTVPTGKVLYIDGWSISAVTDAGGHVFALRLDSTQISWISVNNDGTTSITRKFPDFNNISANAGTVVSVALISGSSSESWGAELDGHLEDV